MPTLKTLEFFVAYDRDGCLGFSDRDAEGARDDMYCSHAQSAKVARIELEVELPDANDSVDEVFVSLAKKAATKAVVKKPAAKRRTTKKA